MQALIMLIFRLLKSQTSFQNKFQTEGNSWKAKSKVKELCLIFWRFFENSYTVDTHQQI